jgi:DNA-binding transcriptional LysR family regulator
MDVHLRELRYFLAVAEHLHFSRAARDLFVSQPALSKRIRALESVIGADLFLRDRRGVALSSAGQALLPGARRALAAWEEAQARLATATALEARRLVIGTSLGIERGLMPRIRRRLARAAPDVQVRVRRIPWSDPTSGLGPRSEAGVDAAFVWLPLPEPQRYGWITVAVEPRRLLVASDHRLAGSRHVQVRDLLEEPFLALPRSTGRARDFWTAADARGGRPVPVVAEVASTEELVEGVGSGLGCCLIVEGNLEAFRRPDITVLEVDDLAPAELVLAWRRDDERPVLRALVEATAAAASVRSDNLRLDEAARGAPA